MKFVYFIKKNTFSKKRKIMLAFFERMWYYIEAVVRRRSNPGVAKFGIALEWGSRGLELESRHSDQKSTEVV